MHLLINLNTEPLRITVGSKYAHSIRIFVVESVTDVFKPPITPANAIASFASQISK